MKKKFALLVLVLSFSARGFAAEHATSMQSNRDMQHNDMQLGAQRCYSATGVVRKVERDRGVVTIFYDAVPELHWPPMTMPFAVRDNNLFEHFEVGERVDFEFVLEAHTALIVTVK
ncbi:MAG: copper-binding protein [Gallionellaceae bacterium]